MVRISLLLLLVSACRVDKPPRGEWDYDEDGFVLDEDCNDEDPSVFSGADEICDGADNDCDGLVDEDLDWTYHYVDADGDGYGDDATAVESCDDLAGYIDQGGDCNDADTGYHPGATEEDCDDPEDYNCDGYTAYSDADADGYIACLECNDGNAAVFPGATEVCNGLDDDCDGTTDEDDAADASTWYADGDDDTYGDATVTKLSCDEPTGYTADDTDCDDANGAANPGATELCNEVDDDCDGTTDEDDAVDASAWYADADGDGYGDAATSARGCDAPAGHLADDTDCDDAAPAVNPGATELCNEVDDDCDGATDESDAADASTWYADADGDGYGDAATSTLSCEAPSGYLADGSDCDDANAAVSPAVSEVCDDGVDDNCDVADDACPPVTCAGTVVTCEEPDNPSADVDGDGITDDCDYCPSTPSGVTVNDGGCACEGSDTYLITPGPGANDGGDYGSVTEAMDTYVDGTSTGGWSSTNHGSSAEMICAYGDPTGTNRCFLRFELSALPTDATLADGTLTFYAYDVAGHGSTYGSASDRDFYASPLTEEWEEMTTTGADQPAVDSAETSDASSCSFTDRSPCELDVGSIVDYLRAGSNYGFRLDDGGTHAFTRYHTSSDDSFEELWPSLEVSYTVP